MGYPPQNPPPRRRRWWVWIVAALITAVLIGGGTWLATGNHDESAPAASTSMSAPAAVSGVISTPELLKMWDERTTPCQEPLIAKGPPANTYGVVPDGVYPVAGDIRARLQVTTVRGDVEGVRGEIQHLFVILLETQGHMVVEDRDANTSIDRANGDAAVEQHAIDHARTMLSIFHTKYDTAVAASFTRLENGTETMTFNDGFDADRICH
jgi:hypothetical protein